MSPIETKVPAPLSYRNFPIFFCPPSLQQNNMLEVNCRIVSALTKVVILWNTTKKRGYLLVASVCPIEQVGVELATVVIRNLQVVRKLPC